MTRLRKVPKANTESSDSNTDFSSRNTTPEPSDDHVQSFYLPRSGLQALISLPRQILFAIAGLFGLAHYARQVVRITPRLPAILSLRSDARSDVGDSENGGDGKVSLNQWIERNVPSLKGRFVPTWWLPNGHLQTMYCVVGNFTKVDKVEYKRTYLRVPDGGTLGLDFTPTHFDSFPDDTPTIVACHGLTGGSHESYVRNILAWVIKPKTEGGLGGRAVVVNFRGCAGVPLTSPQLYSAGTTLDLATSLHFLRSRYPTSPLHGIGFSLGASVLSRYLGETGPSCLLSSGCVLGTPWDTVAMSVRLETHWFISRVYSRAMALNLFKVVDRHYATNPDLFDKGPMEQYMPRIKALKRRRRTTLKQVDEVLTSKIGGPRGIGLWPFNGADEYYAWASPKDLISSIKRPTLALNAMDDPIIDGGALPIDEFTASSHVYTGVSGGGGHLGWFEGSRADRRWILKPVSQFLTAATRDLALQGASIAIAPSNSKEPQEVRGINDEPEMSNGSALGKSPTETEWEWVEDNAHEMAGVGSETGKVGWKVLKEGEDIHGAQGSGSLQGL